MKNVSIRIHGRVQGVGFRYHTQKIAKENNINGIVKNMVDGSVYIEASGANNEIDHFVSWCHRGPQWAYVEQVEVSEMHQDKQYFSFNIK